MNEERTESDVLQQVLSDLEAEGYEVYVHPNRPLLPRFLGGYAPDAIARRNDGNIAIELLRQSSGAKEKAERIAGLFKDQDDWELRLVWIAPASPAQMPKVQTLRGIRSRVREIRELADDRHSGPALLLAWATLEAIGRVLAPKEFQRPQTPGRLLQVLASEGHLTPGEADNLRGLAAKRNKFIHGGLQTRVTKSELSRFADVLTMLVQAAGN